MRDLRYALRMLVRNPWFTTVAVVALALGIGANTAIFSSVNALVLRPYPFPDLDRIVRVWQTYPERGYTQDMVSPADYLDWREQSQTLEDLAGYGAWGPTLTGAGEPEQLNGYFASPSLFRALGAEVALGRIFRAEEERAGDDDVVVLSNGFWQRRFAADPNIVGRQLRLSDRLYTVIGVMPEEFDYPLGADLWKPYALTGDERAPRRRVSALFVVGRLRDGVTLEEARAEMTLIAGRLERDFPDTNEGRGISIRRIREVVDTESRKFVLLLMVAAGFVLLLACANVANIQLARISPRRRELALRTALGASRWRLARQLLVESILLAALGGAAGVLLAMWGIDLQRGAIPENIYRIVAGLRNIRVDVHVLLFAASVAIAAGIVCAVGPVLTIRRQSDLTDALKEGGRTATGSSRNLLRRALVVAEVALAFVLLIGAGLMVRTFQRITEFEVGYNPDNLLTMNLSLPADQYREFHQIHDFYHQLTEDLTELPEVESAAAVLGLGVELTSFRIEGQPPPRRGENLPDIRFLTGDYFGAMGLPIVEGRALTDQELAERPSRVAVISEALARRYFSEPRDALGANLILGSYTIPPLRVVGVAGDVETWYDHATMPTIYLASVNMPPRNGQLLIRTRNDPARAVASVRAVIRNLNRDLPIADVITRRREFEEQASGVRSAANNMTAFALVALLLAASGIFGVVSQSVSQRTHDIGVRVAVGADPRSILALVLRETVVMAAVGLAIGLALAIGLTRAMTSVLTGVVPVETGTFLVVGVVLAGVALLAGYLPARRAARVDPVVALRCE